jgi:hypothetical protein
VNGKPSTGARPGDQLATVQRGSLAHAKQSVADVAGGCLGGASTVVDSPRS